MQITVIGVNDKLLVREVRAACSEGLDNQEIFLFGSRIAPLRWDKRSVPISDYSVLHPVLFDGRSSQVHTLMRPCHRNISIQVEEKPVTVERGCYQ